eukprot:6215343-Pyramimonas_sp.AAC.1
MLAPGLETRTHRGRNACAVLYGSVLYNVLNTRSIMRGRVYLLSGCKDKGLKCTKPRIRLSASQLAVCRQGIYVEYAVEYSKCRALNGILVSTVDDCRLLN